MRVFLTIFSKNGFLLGKQMFVHEFVGTVWWFRGCVEGLYRGLIVLAQFCRFLVSPCRLLFVLCLVNTCSFEQGLFCPGVSLFCPSKEQYRQRKEEQERRREEQRRKQRPEQRRPVPGLGFY